MCDTMQPKEEPEPVVIATPQDFIDALQCNTEAVHLMRYEVCKLRAIVGKLTDMFTNETLN